MRPILVLADDLSGAAELAGIARAYGQSAEVQRQAVADSHALVIAVDTASRGLPADAAAAQVAALTAEAMRLRPAWMYKKVDSLLRGNVRAEIEAVLAETGLARAVLVPANPSRGRVVQGGRYLVNGRPLNESPLAADPEHPRRSAEVEQLLGLGACPLALVSAADALPQAGLVVPDVANSEELVTRAGQIHGRTLPAGAADFFAALLAANAGVAPRSEPQCAAPCLPTPILLACGSPAAWRGRAGECQAAGLPVVALAGEATSALDPIEAALRAPGVCVVTTVGGDTPPTDTPPMARLADLVAGLVRQARVATLLAEGGATATAVAERLGWARFAVTETAPAGVGVLSPLGAGNAPRFLIKPGSYPWPEAIWSQLSPSR